MNLSHHQFFNNSFIEDSSDIAIESFVEQIGIHQIFISKYRSNNFFIIFKYDSHTKLLTSEERDRLLEFLDSAKGKLLKRIINIDIRIHHIKINSESRANSIKYIKKFYGQKNVINNIDYHIESDGITFPFTYLHIPYNDFKRLFFLIYSLNSNVNLGFTNKLVLLAIKAFINDSELEKINNYLKNSQLVNILFNLFNSSLLNNNTLYNSRNATNNLIFLNNKLLYIFDIHKIKVNNAKESANLTRLLENIHINLQNENKSRGGTKKKKNKTK
jgi:hypothetical protein